MQRVPGRGGARNMPLSEGKSTAAQRLGGDLRAQVAQFFFFESSCSSFALDCATVLMDAENNLALARCSGSYSQAYRLFL